MPRLRPGFESRRAHFVRDSNVLENQRFSGALALQAQAIPAGASGEDMYWGRLVCYNPECPKTKNALQFSKEWRAELREAQTAFTWIRGTPTLLEVACSTGLQLLAYKEQGARAVGLDISEESEIYSRLRKMPFVRGDATQLPFKDNSFDLVTTTLFLHGIPYEQQKSALAEMLRVGKEVILVDYIPAVANTMAYRSVDDLELFEDELEEGHYANFRAYFKRGGLPHLIRETGAEIEGGEIGPRGVAHILRITKPF